MSDGTKCEHRRTRLIAEDEHEKYVECLDCGAILEAAELSTGGDIPASGSNETLSDA
jgi:hypothetical protein